VLYTQANDYWEFHLANEKQDNKQMNKRNIIGFAISILAIGLGLYWTMLPGKKEPKKRPNVILIMTDDHTTQAMSCYGSKLIQTPNLDRIANEGMRFDNCYVSNSLCGPSRACILTGKLSHVNGLTDNSKTFDGNQMTFPKLLHQNGYQTGVVGKWHLTSDPQGFDFWSVLTGQGEYYNPDFRENGMDIRENGYVTDIISNKALNFIKNRDTNKPFALLYYHKAPHGNWIPSPEKLGMFNNTIFPEPETLYDDYSTLGTAAKSTLMQINNDLWEDYNLKIADVKELEGGAEIKGINANKADADRSNQKELGLPQLRAEYSRMSAADKLKFVEAFKQRNQEFKTKQLKGKELTAWKYQQFIRDYLATLLSVDESVGKLLNYLKEIGELDNTIIIYTSDQGLFLGEHGWFDKRFMYEESQRTPLLVRYPKMIKPQTTTSALSMNIDFAPTILDLAGIEVPQEMQGRSLKPILESAGKEPEDWRKAVYYHYYEYPGWHSVKRHYGIRTERYKLIHFYNDIDEWELYDLHGNTREHKNLINDPAYSKVKLQMMDLLYKTGKEYMDFDPIEKNHAFNSNN
jgi:arylsulfatase A-like enzyme